jgi:prepilin-type N-terminal cleavage/methylation domain-containing protein
MAILLRPRRRGNLTASSPHDRFGFTLVELLVVIAIIGILIARCCCPPSRRPGRRPGDRSAPTTSSKWGWPFTTIIRPCDVPAGNDHVEQYCGMWSDRDAEQVRRMGLGRIDAPVHGTADAL